MSSKQIKTGDKPNKKKLAKVENAQARQKRLDADIEDQNRVRETVKDFLRGAVPVACTSLAEAEWEHVQGLMEIGLTEMKLAADLRKWRRKSLNTTGRENASRRLAYGIAALSYRPDGVEFIGMKFNVLELHPGDPLRIGGPNPEDDVDSEKGRNRYRQTTDGVPDTELVHSDDLPPDPMKENVEAWADMSENKDVVDTVVSLNTPEGPPSALEGHVVKSRDSLPAEARAWIEKPGNAESVRDALATGFSIDAMRGDEADD